jgi:DNA-binding NarL/FixJ family response regulator
MTIRVLLADDHALMREGLRALLSASGEVSVVAEASTGREALARARETDPDVVLMDIAMPDMNGIEAAALIREKCPRTRIIVLSMHHDSEHVHRALEAGASGYLLKERAAVEVLAALRMVHAGHTYLSEGVTLHARASGGTLSPGPLESLSRRERQVLQLVVEGHSSAAIGLKTNLSRKTVESYRSRLMKKLGVADLPALVKFAVRHGLTPPE